MDGITRTGSSAARRFASRTVGGAAEGPSRGAWCVGRGGWSCLECVMSVARVACSLIHVIVLTLISAHTIGSIVSRLSHATSPSQNPDRRETHSARSRTGHTARHSARRLPRSPTLSRRSGEVCPNAYRITVFVTLTSRTSAPPRAGSPAGYSTLEFCMFAR